MSIEAVIAETVREAVKNAVSEAQVPVMAKLEALEQKVTEISTRMQGFDDLATERDVQVVVETIAGGIEEITRIAQEQVIETGRAELRLMRAAKAAS